MKKKNIVKNEREFSKIINTGQKLYNNLFSLYYINNENNEDYRIGICVSKKIGNAVMRNKIKRQIRAIIDLNKNVYSTKKDYIIIIRRNYLKYNFEEVKSEFIKLFDKLKKVEESVNEKEQK